MQPKPGLSSMIKAQPGEQNLPGSIRISPQSAALDNNVALGFRHITDKSSSPKTVPMDIWPKVGNIAHWVAWGVCGLAAFAFVVVVLTPILLPVLTFGACFSCGLQEWREFSMTAIRMSITPAVISAVAAASAFVIKQGSLVLQRRLEEAKRRGSELRSLEELMKNA